MNYTIETLITEQQISDRVSELASKINKDFNNEPVILIGLLRGSSIFLADLSRKLHGDVRFDFMVASSYGNTTESNRDVRILKDLDDDIFQKNVVIVEDIIDTGYTLTKVIEVLKTRKPKKLSVCTMLDKPLKREMDVKVDYIGFQIPDEFVVGYGIDYAQKHRALPYIGYISFQEEGN